MLRERGRREIKPSRDRPPKLARFGREKESRSGGDGSSADTAAVNERKRKIKGVRENIAGRDMH